MKKKDDGEELGEEFLGRKTKKEQKKLKNDRK